MKLTRKCKKIGEYVEAVGEKKVIPDGNSVYPAGSRIIILDCLKKDCKSYNGCKICEFDNLYE